MSQPTPRVQPATYILYKQRYAVLALFCLICFTNQAMNLTFPNIIRQSQVFLDTKPFWINMLPIVSNVIAVVFGIPTCELFTHKGLRFVLVLTALLNLVCAVLRVVAALWLPQYWLIFVAQIAVGAAQLVSRSASSLIAATWFPETERSLATTIGVMSLYLGMGAGFLIPPLLVDPLHNTKWNFLSLFSVHAGLALVSFIGTVLGAAAAPPTPPSATSPTTIPEVQTAKNSRLWSQDDDDFYRSSTTETPSSDLGVSSMAATTTNVFKLLWNERRNTAFVMLLLSNGLIAGYISGVDALLFQVLSPFGVTEVQTGYMLITGTTSGVIASIVIGRRLDQTRKYKHILVRGYFLFGLLAVVVASNMLFLPASSHAVVGWVFASVNIFLACLLLPMMPVAFELLVEVSYPLSAVISASALQWCNAAFGWVFTVVLAAIVGDASSSTVSGAVFLSEGLLVMLCALLLQCTVKEETRRVECETQGEGAETTPSATAGQIPLTAVEADPLIN